MIKRYYPPKRPIQTQNFTKENKVFKKLLTRIGTTLGVILILTIGLNSSALAHGTVDQHFETSTGGGSFAIVAIGQTFVPTADNLVAVDIFGSSFTTNPVARVSIHVGNPDGLELAAATLTWGAYGWNHIDFGAPIPLTPGNTYSIRASAISGNPAFNVGNGYPNGNYWQCQLTCIPYDFDLGFRTYYEESDTTAPTAAPTQSPNANGNGWNNTDVTVTWNWTDNAGGSGIDPANCITSSVSSGEGAAISLEATCEDLAGNTGTVSYTVNVDKTAPTITLSTPANGVTYLLNQVVIANYACQDEAGGSGLRSCLGTVPNGSAIDTSSSGAKSFAVNAVDNALNSNNANASYSVVYDFSGFSSPVDSVPTLNLAKAGQAIPLKWRITDANGLPVTNLSGVTVTVVSLSCSLGSTTDALEEYASGDSGLQNLGDGYYQFNWKTPKTYANSCKTLKLNLGEGAGFEHTALFKFTK
jgi:hypothetical protein